MDLTIVLAQILGIIFTVLGLSMLVSKKSVVALVEETTRSQGLLWVCGFIAMTMGAVLITLNNFMLGSGTQLLIVIIGWLALLKGILILISPNAMVSMYKKWNIGGIFIFTGILALVLGLIFLYVGFAL